MGKKFSVADALEKNKINIENDENELPAFNEVTRAKALKSVPIVWIPRNEIRTNPEEDEVYDIDEIDALAADIAERGIQTPLNVIPAEDEGYIIIGGHRRLSANDMAKEKYGYKHADSVPCIVNSETRHGREFENTEKMILDNLQRVKSDYSRMMEIIRFEECTLKRREAGEDIPNVRERTKARLGVGDTEITRFKKIHDSLYPDMMPAFRKGLIATTVAYEVAKTEDACQKFISDNWDREEPLSLALFNALTARYLDEKKGNAANSESVASIESEDIPTSNDAPSDNADVKEKKGEKTVSLPKPASIDEGMSMLDTAFTGVRKTLEGASAVQLNKKDVKKVLKKIEKQMAALTALQNELRMLGLGEDTADGE